MSNVSREMPKYQCHKKVWALKIAKLKVASDGTAVITPVEQGYAEFDVESDFVEKHNPREGGYYVQYEDGYESYSPAELFESGYNKI